MANGQTGPSGLYAQMFVRNQEQENATTQLLEMEEKHVQD